VKSVALSAEIERFAAFRLQVNARTVGKRLGRKTQEVIAAAKAGRWKPVAPGVVEVAGESLSGEDFQLLIEPSPGVVCQPLASNDAIVILDLALDEPRERGVARDWCARCSGAPRAGAAPDPHRRSSCPRIGARRRRSAQRIAEQTRRPSSRSLRRRTPRAIRLIAPKWWHRCASCCGAALGGRHRRGFVSPLVLAVRVEAARSRCCCARP
jgi:hypothetical protein